MKRYHEWGYRFNDSARIGDLTVRQRRLMDLADLAEAYIREQQRPDVDTDTGRVDPGFDMAESRRRAFQ
jgi:hypothetical protein